jgi:fatty-acid desaturase
MYPLLSNSAQFSHFHYPILDASALTIGDASGIALVVFLVMWILAQNVGIAMGYHRLLTHGGYLPAQRPYGHSD